MKELSIIAKNLGEAYISLSEVLYLGRAKACAIFFQGLFFDELFMKAELATEISFSFPNEIGILARTARALTNAGIGIKGMLNVSKGSTTQTYMVFSKDAEKAKKILQEQGVDNLGEGNVVGVQMEGETGAVADMAEKLAKANINIANMYVSESVMGPSMVYISTNDDDQAVTVLNKA